MSRPRSTFAAPPPVPVAPTMPLHRFAAAGDVKNVRLELLKDVDVDSVCKGVRLHLRPAQPELYGRALALSNVAFRWPHDG